MGWIGWGVVALATIAAAIGAFVLWAIRTDSVATLDAVDSWFARGRGVRLIAAERYGRHPAQKFELFRPAGAAPPGGFPLVVFAHGGGWHSGDPHDYRFIARTLAARGYATALIGYRLNRDGLFPHMLQDSAAAVRAAIDAAAGEPVDRARLVLAGHSAGAYNVAMLALDPRWLRAAGVDPGLVRGVVPLAGPADFHPFTTDSARNAMGGWPRPEETQPISFARADAPPMLLIHGTDDTVVRPHNSIELARRLSAAGAPTTPLLIQGMGHGGLVMTLARPFDRDPRVANALFAFLRDVLPSAAASSPVKPATD